MAGYTTSEVLEMVLDCEINSGDESEIEEDPEFPLPTADSDSSCTSSEEERGDEQGSVTTQKQYY